MLDEELVSCSVLMVSCHVLGKPGAAGLAHDTEGERHALPGRPRASTFWRRTGTEEHLVTEDAVVVLRLLGDSGTFFQACKGAPPEEDSTSGELDAGLVVLLVVLVSEPLAVVLPVLPGDMDGASLLQSDGVALSVSPGMFDVPGSSSSLAFSSCGTNTSRNALAFSRNALWARRSAHPRAVASNCSRKDTR